MEQYLLDLFLQHPTAGTILAVIGTARIINKPLFALFHAVVDVTKTTVDNAFLEKVEASKVYKAFLFILDIAFSVKVKK